MSEAKVGRRSLISGGVKSLAVGASAAVITGTLVAQVANAGGCSKYTIERYMEYMDAFNRDGRGNGSGDFGRFYTADIVYERGQNHTMHGIQSIVDFYTEMFEHVHQELRLLNFAATNNFIASEVESRFVVLKDWNHDSGISLRKGREFASHDFIHYGVSDDGLINRARFANFRRFNDNHKR